MRYRFKLKEYHAWRYGYAKEARIHLDAKNIVEKHVGGKWIRVSP